MKPKSRMNQSDFKPSYNKRYFGEFSCTCGRWWMSGNAWLNFRQTCEGCGTKVEPNLRPLRAPSSEQAEEKPHPQEKCERCIAFGGYCRDSENKELCSNYTLSDQAVSRFDLKNNPLTDELLCSFLSDSPSQDSGEISWIPNMRNTASRVDNTESVLSYASVARRCVKPLPSKTYNKPSTTNSSNRTSISTESDDNQSDKDKDADKNGDTSYSNCSGERYSLNSDKIIATIVLLITLIDAILAYWYRKD